MITKVKRAPCPARQTRVNNRMCAHCHVKLRPQCTHDTCSKCRNLPTRPGRRCGTCAKLLRKDSQAEACVTCRRVSGDRGQTSEARRTYQERYAREHSERKIAQGRVWREANPVRVAEKRRQGDAVRRARLIGLHVESVDPSIVWQRDEGVCHLCSLPCDVENWHLEHVIPVARGGPHCYANTAVAHPLCNWSKGAKMATSVRGQAALDAFWIFHVGAL